MKILVLTSSFPRYKNDWWQQAVLSIYSNMDLKKYHVTVLAPSAPGALSRENIDGVDVRRFMYFFPKSLQLLTSGEGVLYTSRKNKFIGKIQVLTFIIAEFLATMSILAHEDFDIIHANWIIPQGLIAILAKFIFGKPVMVTVHGTDIFALKKLNYIKAFILYFCDLCTANSSSTLEAANEIYNSTKNRIVHIGVDLEMFNPKKKKEGWRKKYGSDPKIIVGVGRLIKWKGFEYLIKAFPPVVAKFPQSKLIIIGRGPEEYNLKELAVKLGLEVDKNVFFPGSITPTELSVIYASCNIVVSPSITISKTGEKEGMGNVVLEARASGTPVIASRSGGLIDTVDGKSNGLLFKEKDYKELSKHILSILSNKKLRESLSKNGLKYVREKFAWKVASRNFTKLYDEIV